MKHSLWVVSAAALLSGAMPVAAQLKTIADTGPGPIVPPNPATKLTLHPARVPVPALKYRLLPEARDLKPGNAATLYYRAFTPEWQVELKKPEIRKDLDKWLDDTSKPPPNALKFVLHSAALKEIDLAARRAYCDWEMLDRLRKEGIGMLMVDIQSFRTFASLLVARARFQMLDKKFDDAIYTLQTGFQFGRHVSAGPTVIQSLVGTAITALMTGEVEQLMQQPGAPNLYWALTNLPRPFIDLHTPLEGEKIFIDSYFPGWRDMLKDPQAAPMSPQEMDAFVTKIFEGVNTFGLQATANEFQTFGVKTALGVMAASCYPDGRKFLLEQGHPKKLVDQMAVSQVALLYEISQFDQFYDDMIKWYGLPYPEMRKGVLAAEAKLKQAKAQSKPGTMLATLLLPAMIKVSEASYRTDRKIALLRCIEALRIYAADHDDKLPAALADIHEVPVPNDPYTGKAFGYEVDNATAILNVLVTPGTYPIPGYNGKFEITMQP